MSLEGYQIEILEALDGAGPSSIKQVIGLVTYSDEFSDVKEDLIKLKETGLIGKYTNGTWHMTGKGKRALESLRDGHVVIIDKPSTPPRKEVPSAAVSVAEPKQLFPQKHPALAAFDRAAGIKPRSIMNIELKLDVLDRLAELMSDDIRDVLLDIKSDLSA